MNILQNKNAIIYGAGGRAETAQVDAFDEKAVKGKRISLFLIIFWVNIHSSCNDSQ
jgi:hypothetical protein